MVTSGRWIVSNIPLSILSFGRVPLCDVTCINNVLGLVASDKKMFLFSIQTYIKHVIPRTRAIFGPQGHNLNTFGRNLLKSATYK